MSTVTQANRPVKRQIHVRLIRAGRGWIGQTILRFGDLSFLVAETRPYKPTKAKRTIKPKAGPVQDRRGMTDTVPPTRQELVQRGVITACGVTDLCESCGCNPKLQPCPWCMAGFPEVAA